jgi:hypothetical protein
MMLQPNLSTPNAIDNDYLTRAARRARVADRIFACSHQYIDGMVINSRVARSEDPLGPKYSPCSRCLIRFHGGCSGIDLLFEAMAHGSLPATFLAHKNEWHCPAWTDGNARLLGLLPGKSAAEARMY